jgi:hypothetical protein
LLLRSMALAKHISCLCPTLKLLPPSWTFISKAVTAVLRSTYKLIQRFDNALNWKKLVLRINVDFTRSKMNWTDFMRRRWPRSVWWPSG